MAQERIIARLRPGSRGVPVDACVKIISVMGKSKKQIYINLILLCSSALLALVVLETALALFWPHKVILRSFHEQYHPVLGWANKPDVEGEVMTRLYNLFHRSHNSKGLRSSREFAYERTPGVRRILMVGDSFFWGYDVDDPQVVSEVLQNKLGDAVEVINVAVAGYGTDQALLWLLEEGVKYRPDIVILSLFPTNDLEEIALSISYGYPKPFFALDSGRLVLRNVPVPDTRESRRKAFDKPDSAFGRLKKFLRHNTHTYQFITERLNSVPGLRRLFIRLGLGDEYTIALPGIPSFKLKEEKVPELFEALIREFRQVCAEQGAGLLLFFIPESEEIPSAPQRNDEMAKYLSEFSKDNGIELLSLLPVVRGYGLEGKRLYADHWTPLGHRAAAEAISEWLRSKGWAP